MFPGPTELLLIGYSIESIWTHKSKSNTLTQKTNSQTCKPRGISQVTNGIIFCVCSTSAISVLQSVLKDGKKNATRFRRRKSHSEVETNDEFGRAKQRKGSISAIFYCIRKPGENQSRKSKSYESAS